MRKTLFKIHSYLALTALVPLIIVSLTGSVLVFKTEVDQFLMPEVASLEGLVSNRAAAPERMSFNELKENIEETFQDYILGSWELFNDGKEADRVYLIKKGTDDWYKIYFDPYQNQVLSEPVSLTSYLTDWLLEIHYTFLLNGIGGEHSQWGTLLGLLAGLALSFLGITGLIIHRKFWLQLIKLRFNKSLRTFYSDFHKLAGAWSSPVILVLGITGVYFNAIVYYHEIFEHPSEEHFTPTEKLYASEIDFDKILLSSQKHLESFTPTYVLFPYEPEVNIMVFGYQPGVNPFASNYSSTVTFDKKSGDYLSAASGGDAALATQVFDSFRELHFGSFAGLASKLFWCVLGLSPVFLGVSGAYLWLFRKSKKNRNQRRKGRDSFRGNAEQLLG